MTEENAKNEIIGHNKNGVKVRKESEMVASQSWCRQRCQSSSRSSPQPSNVSSNPIVVLLDECISSLAGLVGKLKEESLSTLPNVSATKNSTMALSEQELPQNDGTKRNTQTSNTSTPKPSLVNNKNGKEENGIEHERRTKSCQIPRVFCGTCGSSHWCPSDVMLKDNEFDYQSTENTPNRFHHESKESTNSSTSIVTPNGSMSPHKSKTNDVIDSRRKRIASDSRFSDVESTQSMPDAKIPKFRKIDACRCSRCCVDSDSSMDVEDETLYQTGFNRPALLKVSESSVGDPLIHKPDDTTVIREERDDDGHQCNCGRHKQTNALGTVLVMFKAIIDEALRSTNGKLDNTVVDKREEHDDGFCPFNGQCRRVHLGTANGVQSSGSMELDNTENDQSSRKQEGKTVSGSLPENIKIKSLATKTKKSKK